MDVAGLVEQYDKAHPLLLGIHRRTSDRRDHKAIVNSQSLSRILDEMRALQ